MTERPSRTALLAAFAAIYLFWGGTFLALRYAVAEVPPLITIAIRCIFGALLLYAWLALRGDLERTTRQQWITSAVAGTFLFVGGHGALAWAERGVSSGQAALFMTAIPLWLVLITSVRERRTPSPLVIGGLVLGVVGVALLTSGNGTWSGSLLERLALVESGLSWGIGSVVARDGARPHSAAQSTAMQLGAGGVSVIALSAAVGEFGGWSPEQVSLRGASSLVFLVVAGTVLGFGAYTWLLRVTTPAAVGTYAFVNPVVALALAWAVGDEPFSLRTVVSGVIVLAAVGMIWISTARHSPSADKTLASRPGANPAGVRGHDPDRLLLRGVLADGERSVAHTGPAGPGAPAAGARGAGLHGDLSSRG